MRTVLNRLKGVKPETGRDVRQSSQVKPERETEKKSTTSGSIVPEVWIMFGLLLSLVMQTGLGNQRDRK